MFNKQILQLPAHLLIGSGGVRRVYRHPSDEGKCIKITHNKSRSRAVCREISYLKKYQRQGKPFKHLPHFYGFCRTNLGKGSIFELIRDYDGNISQKLSDHATKIVKAPLPAPKILSLLNELRRHLLAHRIIVSDPAPHNLVVQFVAPEQPRLVVVDGIGNPHFIKIADYSGNSAHRIIKKKWH